MTIEGLQGRRLLIANRGEIAIRVARTATALGMTSVAVYASDDADQLHVRTAPSAASLPGVGVAAYLDIDAMIEAALGNRCTMVHPGYGFLSENPDFARACARDGLRFVGPRPEILGLFGDKVRARNHAVRCRVPVLPATRGGASLEEAIEFFASHGSADGVMIKAMAGGGGRGQRQVTNADKLAESYQRSQSEALHAFGSADVFIEQYCARVRHIEVQIVGDGSGTVVHLWDRDCSIQRRNQKLVEFAPALGLPPELRAAIHSAAVEVGRAARLDNVATVEFLVEAPQDGYPDGRFWFLEINPRLQVEHTVTEEITGYDLVGVQLQLASGRSLEQIGLTQDRISPPAGYAVQARVLLEELTPDGTISPATGEITIYEPPEKPGIRVDGHGFAGYHASARYDSLIAKVIAHDNSATAQPSDVVGLALDALNQFKIDGVATNLALMRWILAEAPVTEGRAETRFLRDNIHHFWQQVRPDAVEAADQPAATDPLSGEEIRAPMTGIVTSLLVSIGDLVDSGQDVAVLESMKMEHLVRATSAGVVTRIDIAVGDEVRATQVVMRTEGTGESSLPTVTATSERDPGLVRDDLATILQMHATILDEARPEAVARRHASSRLTARENIANLTDPGSFLEVGPLIVAAQRARRSVEELAAKSPADGLVGGVATVNSELFGRTASQCVVMAYDYTVFAGTQGVMNHRKTDRLLEVAHTRHLPVLVYAEGGGGRPGDTDRTPGTTFEPRAFDILSHLSGAVPLVGIVAGNCFAGNAVLLGLCDVIIATPQACIGMGGPAMIEAGGLGRYAAEEIGPIDVQRANGVVDIAVAHEAEAAVVARQYVSYFQGDVAEWECADQRLLRQVVPENRLRSYEIRDAISLLADTGSTLELRADFGAGIVTALVRVEGRPLGIIANNCQHLGGAIDRDSADKAARFMQLCDAFDLPIVSLIDNPGFMVGPEVEATAAVRHFSRMVMIGANARTPRGAIVVRKAYGLGTLAMYGGRSKITAFNVAWPTAEFGPMNLEGAVRLAYRAELERQPDEAARQALYEELLRQQYDKGKAVNAATVFEVDDVIDPADSRSWISQILTTPRTNAARDRPRRYIDTW